VAIAGDPRLWLPLFSPGLVPQIVELVLDSWSSFAGPKPSENEVPITLRFCCHLKLRKNSLRDLPVRIERESTEDDTIRGRERGRIDIRFTEAYSCREDVYFAFECKRLNVPPSRPSKRKTVRSLARPYVHDGLMRFVTGQYGRNLEHGGMIGYVMDSDTPAAVRSVDRCVRIARRRLKLAGRETLRDSRVTQGRGEVKETVHGTGARTLTIQHLFLACAEAPRRSGK
jgi:hypothetical protein